jgi:hypothetical protein
VAVAAAQAACALGDTEAALRWVAAAVNLSFDGLDTLARLNSAGGFDDLRADPRYATLIDGLGN